MRALGPRLVKPLNLQIAHALHDDRVALCVVHGRLTSGEGGGGPEPAVGVAEVGDGIRAGVLGGGVGDGHVLFCCVDVLL